MFTGNRPANLAYGTAAEEIRKNRRYYDFASVKYLVTNGTSLAGYVYDTLTDVGGDWRPANLTGNLSAVFRAPVDGIATIQVQVGTFGRKNPGMLELHVLNEDGALLDSSAIASSHLIDNRYCDFHFSRLHGLLGKSLHLSLSFKPGSQESVIAAYVPSDIRSQGFAFRVPSTEQDFRLVRSDQDTGTSIWENSRATPRVFLAPEVKVVSTPEEALSMLKDIPNLTRSVCVDLEGQSQQDPDPTQPAGSLREFRLSPNEVWIKYTANLPGVLTLTDSFSDGWHAEVDGKQVPVIRVDGVFRGVRIDAAGEMNVRFWYRPPRWNLSLGLGFIGLITLVFANFHGRRRMQRRNAGEPRQQGQSAVPLN
jgi:hypothetical protein